MKFRRSSFLKLICLLIFMSSSPASAHKIHVSVTQFEYNKSNQRVEIALRVFSDDLENALSKHAGRAIKLIPSDPAKNRELGDLVVSYLADSFELKNKTGKVVRLNWDGMEGQTDVHWIYLEARAPSGLEGFQLRNRIFFDLFDDQVNIVNTRHGSKQLGVMFEAKDGFKPIL